MALRRCLPASSAHRWDWYSPRAERTPEAVAVSRAYRRRPGPIEMMAWAFVISGDSRRVIARQTYRLGCNRLPLSPTASRTKTNPWVSNPLPIVDICLPRGNWAKQLQTYLAYQNCHQGRERAGGSVVLARSWWSWSISLALVWSWSRRCLTSSVSISTRSGWSLCSPASGSAWLFTCTTQRKPCGVGSWWPVSNPVVNRRLTVWELIDKARAASAMLMFMVPVYPRDYLAGYSVSMRCSLTLRRSAECPKA